jgi:hypothetical protein
VKIKNAYVFFLVALKLMVQLSTCTKSQTIPEKVTNDGDAMFATKRRNMAAYHLLDWYNPSFFS